MMTMHSLGTQIHQK